MAELIASSGFKIGLQHRFDLGDVAKIIAAFVMAGRTGGQNDLIKRQIGDDLVQLGIVRLPPQL
ncbi:hypothetical protein G6L63_11370 [Agrobacterium vitis]|uniref:Uncharacterized protein n=1 Tax=Agrobacterium vitis TaxID=373 RepID=A0A368NII5_AGRVI|nr:hypothetical protein [Agrobacterium vitis]KAA3511933.1 hypothetical protein DXM22_17050 [Agrobacterium vitis]KAA3525378.1 hypothetical protein DXT89_18840 [Agrobacterium vitis]MCF1479155.1 hypothetical protein [Agrobacterium vitis]MUZ97758.1 hypothetical protein [Agrobacterium vitis]MVA30262.1 hypothetical protein [Agrobacterium vitis]